MAFNGSGVFQRLYNWTNDANAGIKIRTDRMDAEHNGFATGLSTCVTKDGQTTPTANLPMGGYKHTSVADGSARTDYASLGQIQDSGIIWGGTAGGTANVITFNLTPTLTAYVAGQQFAFVSSAANTGATTVNINGVGAKNIYRNGAALTGYEIASGTLVYIIYDGAQFQLISINGSYTLGPYNEKYASPSSSAGVLVLDWLLSPHKKVTLTESITTLTLSNPGPSSSLTGHLFYVTQGGSGSYTITWPASVVYAVGTAPTLTITVGKTDVFNLLYDAGSGKYVLSVIALNLTL